MASESSSNNFYMDNNGISFLAAMGNCQFYSNEGPSAADVVAMSNSDNNNNNSNDIDKENGRKTVAHGNPHQGHMNIGNNNANMNINSAMEGARIEKESSAALTNETGTGNNNCDGSNASSNKRHANTDDQQQQQQQHANRWNDTSQMTHSHANGNASTNAHTHNDDRIQNAYGHISSVAPTPPPAQHPNALWQFDGSRNPWHFNGIPGCYQRLYSDSSNVADAQTHYPYHHHHRHHHLQHIDHNVMKSASTYAQSSYQGLFYCIPTCL